MSEFTKYQVVTDQTGGSLDLAAFRALIDFHIGQGTDGIVVVGTTGESPTVDVEEHELLIAEAVKHAETLVQEHFTTQLQALEENLRTDIRQKKKIVLKTLENIYLVEIQNITFCESDGCYTNVHMVAGEKIMISRTLREFDDMLSDSGFYRVHKSYLINLSHITRFEKQEGGYIILASGAKVPVSSRKREELLQMFEKLNG